MNTIHYDAFQEICSWLDAKALGRLGQTAKSVLNLVNHNSIWETLVNKTISNPPLFLENITWKKYYEEHGTIRLMVQTTDLSGKPYHFPITIDLKGELITFYQKINTVTHYCDYKFLNEVFKRIPGSFTFQQKCKTFDGYYFRDLSQNERTKKLIRAFEWSDPRIQDFRISTTTTGSISTDKMELDQRCKRNFQNLKNRNEIRNFNFVLK